MTRARIETLLAELSLEEKLGQMTLVSAGQAVTGPEGPLDHLDHAPTLQFYGGKLGIDATHKGPQEGTREWPPEIEMSDEVRRLVDERWDEYGLGAAAEADGRSAGALRQLLRR